MSEPPHLEVLPCSEDERFSNAAQGNSLGSVNSPSMTQHSQISQNKLCFCPQKHSESSISSLFKIILWKILIKSSSLPGLFLHDDGDIGNGRDLI